LIYLSLAILTSASIALIFKYSEGRSMDRYVVTSFNYLAASLVSAVIIAVSGLEFPFVSMPVNFKDLAAVFPSSGGPLDLKASLAWALVVGVPAGVFFFLAFIYYQKGINENGAGLAGAFSKIGILIPMSISIVVWNEIPTVLQTAGIALSVISILLVNISFRNFSLDKLRLTLLALFLFSGLAEFSNKVFQNYGLLKHRLVFLFFVFFTAFLISGAFLLSRKKLPRPRAMVTGLIVGLPNLFCSYFLIQALDGIKASVVFPIYTATTIVVINLGGYLIFNERLENRERLSVVLTIIALVMINL
jgi:multidrug transporter EmrE-like cation transporter